MPTATILEAMADERLFGRFFRGRSWDGWRAFLAGLFRLPLGVSQMEIWRRHTGRDVPSERFDEAWIVAGRRSGKSRISAFIATFLACFVDWRRYLSAGETATVMLLAADRKQASVLMNYILGFLHGIPILHKLVKSETQDTVRLTNGVEIEIHTSSFRSVRGYSIPVVLCDEVAFWMDADSKNPAKEILQALRPAMAQFPNSLLLAFSSPYAKKGLLWETHRDHYAKNESPILVWQGASRDMNPSISALTVLRAKSRDAAAAKSEYLALFRDDLETMFSREILESCVIPRRTELPYKPGMQYKAFCDPSGGSSDSFTLAIAHEEGGKAVLDLFREVTAPFSPAEVIAELVPELQRFHIHEITGDAYGGEFPREHFRKCGINYKVSEQTRSELYLAFLPRLMSHPLSCWTTSARFCNFAVWKGERGEAGGIAWITRAGSTMIARTRWRARSCWREGAESSWISWTT